MFGVLLPNKSILKDKNGNFVMCKNRNEIQEWIDENNCPITDGMSFVSYAGDCIFCGIAMYTAFLTILPSQRTLQCMASIKTTA